MEAAAKKEFVNVILDINQAYPRKRITRTLKLFGYKIVYNRGYKSNLWGRFGGGWNWKLGVDIGGSDIILNCLVFSLRINKLKA